MASSTIGMLMTASVAAAMPSLRQQQQAMPVPAECSSRPQKKATAHHKKTRPKKTQPWDVKRRGPTAYPPLLVLPPDWTLVSSESPSEEPAAAAAGAGEVEVVSAAP